MVPRINGQAMILIYIASVLACSAAEFSIVVPNASVSAPLGSSVVLPCGLSPSLNARTFEVRWSKQGEHDPILLYQDQKVQENVGKDQYRDRVSLIGELDKGNVSLKLDNLTVVDKGEYICFVKSISWYEKGSMNLVVKALGSTPLFLHKEAGEKVNITCMSGGWSPKPTLTWRDSAGRELPNSHTYYRTDSEGLVSVSSWLLFSPSDSEWISCTVGLNGQEIREGRIVPLKGFWREAFISTLVLSLIVLSTFTVLLILFRKGLLPHCSSHKNAKAAADSHVSLPAETVPLNATENATQADPHESLPVKSVPLNATKNTNQGISSLYTPPEPTEESSWKVRYKVSLTLDPSTALGSLKVSTDCKSVSYEKPSGDSKSKFPHVLSKEELSSGLFYWEVMVWDKTSSAQPNSSWCVGVTQKPHSDSVLKALCYEEGKGLYPNTQDFTNLTSKYTVTKLGLYLNCQSNALSFYNVDKTSHNLLYTFHNMPHGTYFALFSPGVKDLNRVRILD
ncbi:butyrophilin subfamily 1 member A1 isoform X2 [Pangasianodon hypophthalmus]|uniref:butyrophilin subfamily 1 member A1 isoform X2 n=1 Tax=Pangasianodon hypophthalmus TaxID=310915 RepID=UPI00230801E7|nr:butyrophilin subfamily 1 member A1 isoform X2 [Pangasianodon hypophthalmus]